MFTEPKIEFVEIDLTSSIVTGSCTDGVSDGGTYCIDSITTTDCGKPMASTNLEDESVTEDAVGSIMDPVAEELFFQ